MSVKKFKLEESSNSADYIKKLSVNTLEDLMDVAWNYKAYERTKDEYFSLWKMIPVLEELNEMVGMMELKQSIVNFILYYIQGLHKNDRGASDEGDLLHCVLYGDPGMGKTTAANIIAKIYAAMGFLSKGHVIKAKITDFIAKYLGQSEHYTMDLLNRAKGGVLFIDEVYSLSSESEFAISAGNVLNAFLSENKHDFVCIIAGYEKDVKEKFMTINPGLARRFPWQFTIEPYTSLEMFQIFEKIASRTGWKIEENKNIATLFDSKNFSFGGGDMETLLTKCKLIHSKNIFFKKEINKLLTYEEIKEAISKKKIKKEVLTYFL